MQPQAAIINIQRQATEVNDSMPVFTKDSAQIPAGVKQAIENKTRPSWASRKLMCENIVDFCKTNVPNLERTMFNPVARHLVNLYPSSFKDTIPMSDHGSDTLAKELRDKFDNTKRPNKAARLQAEAPKEAYGCILFNPSRPHNETDETQEQKRLRLLNMHHLAKKEWNWKEVKKLSEETFYWQRQDLQKTIDRPPTPAPKKRKRKDPNEEVDEDEPAAIAPQAPKLTLSQIKERWPFLFTIKGLHYHFKALTSKDLRENLDQYIRNTAGLLCEYLATKSDSLAKLSRQMKRAEKAGCSQAKQSGLILMLLEYFKERQSQDFMRFVDVSKIVYSTTFHNIEKQS